MKTASELAKIATSTTNYEVEEVVNAAESAAKKNRRSLLWARLRNESKEVLRKNGYVVQECDSACDENMGEYNIIKW